MEVRSLAAVAEAQWRRWWKPAVASACWALYALVYVATFWLFGADAATLAALPVAVVALIFGLRAGVVAALLGFPVTSTLTYLAAPDFQPLSPSHLVTAFPGTLVLLTLGVVLGRLHDLGELSRSRSERLRHHALHDQLTGLPNRAMMQKKLEEAILLARRRKGGACLLLLDLDGFKIVNDSVGHSAGDQLLVEVGNRLRPLLGAQDTLARMGGDEFALVLPEAGDQGPMEMVRGIHQALDRPFLIEGQLFNVAGSVGVALYPDHGADSDSLLRRADRAMYIAKGSGSGYATSEADDGLAPALAGETLLAELRRAVAQRELVLHFQPQVELATGRPIGMEALVRWEHPERGLVPPREFIHVCERTGLIRSLTEWVIEAALRQCETWQGAGLKVPVVVNLTHQSLLDPKLPRTVRKALAEFRVDPKMVGFEVTEATLMRDPDVVDQALDRLRALGTRILLDDFGTGYSSLACLQRVKVDAVKLDKSFVTRMAVDPGVAGIVGSLVRISHDLDCPVIAEGVEDQDAWDLLEDLHCDAAQGFFVSAPIPSRWVNAWLERACSASLTRRAKQRLQDGAVEATVPLHVVETGSRQEAAAV